MTEQTQIQPLIGAIVANANNVLLFTIFVARINKMPKIEYWLGVILILSMVPLFYLLITEFANQQSLLYFIQIGLMISYLIVELLLDYILKIEFRQNQSIVLLYVMLFFAGTGGMIGVASHAGKFWAIVTIISFLIMAVSAMTMHIITGE